MPSMQQPSSAVIEHLARYFRRNGYVRMPQVDRRSANPRQYKKGYEVRFVANTEAELHTIRELLKMAGFNLAEPFIHARQWRQPLYGKKAVMQFLNMIGWKPEDPEQGQAMAEQSSP